MIPVRQSSHPPIARSTCSGGCAAEIIRPFEPILGNTAAPPHTAQRHNGITRWMEEAAVSVLMIMTWSTKRDRSGPRCRIARSSRANNGATIDKFVGVDATTASHSNAAAAATIRSRAQFTHPALAGMAKGPIETSSQSIRTPRQAMPDWKARAAAARKASVFSCASTTIARSTPAWTSRMGRSEPNTTRGPKTR